LKISVLEAFIRLQVDITADNINTHRQFTSTTLPRLAYSNPTVRFHVDRKPSSRTKAKDPEIQERATKAAEEESKGSKEKAERRTPRMTIEFGKSYPFYTIIWPLDGVLKHPILFGVVQRKGRARRSILRG
jgi:hypothetical protein